MTIDPKAHDEAAEALLTRIAGAAQNANIVQLEHLARAYAYVAGNVKATEDGMTFM